MTKTDRIAVVLLVGLWGVFFWRLFTPTSADALSTTDGDFTGQFVSWLSYSAERFHAGELPLWNPYMYGGTPFLPDPQMAVFYPPRWLTIAYLSLHQPPTNADLFRALQTEVTLHALLGTLLMYAFLRRLSGVGGSFMGAVLFGFGGYMTSYPLIQMPIGESVAWIPLILLGIHTAIQPDGIRWRWVGIAGMAYTLCILAGHPQTYLLTGYLLTSYVVYRGWRVWKPATLTDRQAGSKVDKVDNKADSKTAVPTPPAGHHMPPLSTGGKGLGVRLLSQWRRTGLGVRLPTHWRRVVFIMLVIGLISGGLSAIQLIPGLLYQGETTRTSFSFDHKGNGFEFHELLMVLFPRVLGPWTPLYVGIIALFLIGVAIWHRVDDWGYWLGIGGVACVLSFGKHAMLYNLFYLMAPGFTFFRSQERAVVVFTLAASVLLARGTEQLLHHNWSASERRRLFSVGWGLVVVCGVFAIVFQILRLTNPLHHPSAQSTMLAFVLALISLGVVRWVSTTRPRYGLVVIGALLVFDLFTINMNNTFNYDPVPISKRLQATSAIQAMQATLDEGAKVDGLRGIGNSYGALWRLPDIYGDGPLRPKALEFYLWDLPASRRWELLAVQVVNSGDKELAVAAEPIAAGVDYQGLFSVYELSAPRPFAHLVYKADVVNGQGFARELTADPRYPLREQVVLERQPSGPLPDEPGIGQATLTRYDPEQIAVNTISDTPSILTLALPYVSGWSVQVDGKSVERLRTYGGLTGVYLTAGQHEVTLRYQPRGLKVGATISAMTAALLTLAGLVGVGMGRRGRAL